MEERDERREALHAIVRGIVQGVGFRYFVQRQARSLGLRGWVRNRPDGTVEVWVEGPRPHLQALLKALRAGPPHARVDEVTVTWRAPRGEGPFRIRF